MRILDRAYYSKNGLDKMGILDRSYYLDNYWNNSRAHGPQPAPGPGPGPGPF